MTKIINPELTTNLATKEEMNTKFNSLEPVTLYENESGTNADITLSDSAENYTFIEVYAKNNDNMWGYSKFYNPNGKKAILPVWYVNYKTGTNWISKMQIREFNGTAFNVTGYQATTIYQKNVSGQSADNLVYVTLILGYK